jgi:hypothetical protein
MGRRRRKRRRRKRRRRKRRRGHINYIDRVESREP